MLSKDSHKAYEKYISLLKVIPLEDLKLSLIRQIEIVHKANYQIQFLSEELKRRDLK